MSAPVAPVRRPGTVTFVVVLLWLGAILEIIGGVIMLLGAGNVEFQDQTRQTQQVLLWMGIVTIAMALLTILFAVGLATGSNAVRILVSILIVLQILSDAWEMTVARNASVWTGLVAILFWLLILGMLWTSRASAFFSQR